MKSKIINRTHINGYLYEHKLQHRVSGPNSKNPGTPFIMGTVDIATDDALTNIVTVHFSYVTATTASGSNNATYAVLSGIIDGTYKSVMEHGAENATMFNIDSAIGLNEWYDRNDNERLVSTKRNEGGFIRVASSLDKSEDTRSTFDTDIIIYNVKRIEANPERNLPERGVISGYIMDFRKSFLPVEYTVMNPAAIDYFEGLEASERHPIFTEVRGKQLSTTTVNRVEEESAFGETYVREYSNSRKDFYVTWAKKEPYVIDEDGDISPAEIKKGLADRETALAEVKRRQNEYQASQNTTSAFANNTVEEEFKF